MTLSKLQLLIISSFVLLSYGCQSKNPYISIGKIKYESKYTSTKFKVQLLPDTGEGFSRYLENFAIVSAEDNDGFKYTLLSPTNRKGVTEPELNDLNLYYSVPIDNSKINEFIDKINQSIAKWDEEYVDSKGISETFDISSSKTKMKFIFESSSKGSLAYIMIFTGKYIQYINKGEIVEYEKSFTFDLENKKELQTLVDLLRQSYSEKQLK